MATQTLLDQCLVILYSIKDDREHLEKMLKFMQQEFCEEEVDMTVMEDHLAQVPVKYHAVVKEIADNMGAQLISFVVPETLEIDAVPQQLEYVDIDKQVYISDWENRVKIDPLDSHDSYEIMENFVAQFPNNREKNRLSAAVSGYKPFASFNRIIHQSEFREKWFEFRQKELERFVIDNYLHIISEKE